jgi:hypothetical protein
LGSLIQLARHGADRGEYDEPTTTDQAINKVRHVVDVGERAIARRWKPVAIL